MQKINVLHIIKSLGRGGAEMLLPETLKLHDKNKFCFNYIYFLPSKNQMVKAIEEAGGDVVCFSAKNNIELFLKSKPIIKFCKENNIHIIHCHLPWAGFVGRYIFKATHIPVVYSEHNMQERYHTITKLINKNTFNHQSLAIGVSADVSSSINKNIHPKIPVKTLLNGVNTKSFVRDKESGIKIRKELGIPSGALVIGNIAVFRFQKRLKEWLQTFSEIQKNNPNVYGILVGAGPLEKEIKEELKRLNLENSVFLPGLQTEVKPFLSAMDIFMMTSSFEGLPIALLEAMSMECAIISTDAGGIKEVIRNGKDGYICEVNNHQILPKLCQDLIDNPDELRKMQGAARERVICEFSLTNMVNELETLYETLVKN